MEVELAVVASNFAPALRLGQDTAQGGLIFVKKITPQAWLALFIPECGDLQLLGNLRMSDDAHGA